MSDEAKRLAREALGDEDKLRAEGDSISKQLAAQFLAESPNAAALERSGGPPPAENGGYGPLAYGPEIYRAAGMPYPGDLASQGAAIQQQQAAQLGAPSPNADALARSGATQRGPMLNFALPEMPDRNDEVLAHMDATANAPPAFRGANSSPFEPILTPEQKADVAKGSAELDAQKAAAAAQAGKPPGVPIGDVGATDQAGSGATIQGTSGYWRPGVGFVPTGRQIQGGVTGPNAEAAQIAAMGSVDQGARAADLAERNAQAQIPAVQRAAQMKAAADVSYMDEMKRSMLRKQQAMQSADQEVATLRKQARETANQPGYWEEHGGVAGKILSSIGVALGAAAATATGTQNFALQSLQHNIEADAREKAAKIQAARGNVADAVDAHGAKLSRMDVQQADLFKVRAANYERAASELDAELAKPEYANPRAQAEGAKMRASLLDGAMHNQMGLANLVGDRVHTAEGYDRGGWVGGQAAAPAKDRHTVNLPDGRTVAFDEKEDRAKAQERLLASQDLQKIIDKAKTLRAERSAIIKSGNPLDAKKAYVIDRELDSLAEKALPAWSTSKGQGQVKEEEARRYKMSLFPFSDLMNPGADKIIEGAATENKDNVDAVVKAYGGRVVQSGYAINPKTGRLEPTADYVGQDIRPSRVGGNPSGFKPVVK